MLTFKSRDNNKIMKKIILIVVLIFSFQNNLLASEFNEQNQFNQWLLENGHSQYLKNGGAKVDACAKFKKNSDAWLNEECGFYPKGKMITENNLNIKLVNKSLSTTNITSQANPNLDTLIYYLWKYSYRNRSNHLKEFKPKNSSYDFKFNLIEDKFLKKQMKTKGILSYLYYQDGEVLIDEFSPKERLGEFLNNETKFYSMSMGK